MNSMFSYVSNFEQWPGEIVFGHIKKKQKQKSSNQKSTHILIKLGKEHLAAFKMFLFCFFLCVRAYLCVCVKQQ